jgi:hypothetical protein
MVKIKEEIIELMETDDAVSYIKLNIHYWFLYI